MSTLHFLNVKNGDCSIIKHNTGRVTVIDVNNARKESSEEKWLKAFNYSLMENSRKRLGNFYQKNEPVNPVEYLKSLNITSIFRFILTHPDMDHMDGIKYFFDEFSPLNFWDTDNTEEKNFDSVSPYNEEDWIFYKNIRDGASDFIKRLTLYSNSYGSCYNRDVNDDPGADGLYILSPTKELIQQANESGNFNDSSYVILYRSCGGKILFCGDAQEKTWEHILSNHSDDIKDADILIAPHHGRKPANRTYDFLDIVNPKITFFGNASSEHLAYDAWNYRKLKYITNNQANCIVVNINSNGMEFYVTNKSYAESENLETFYNNDLKAYFIGFLHKSEVSVD